MNGSLPKLVRIYKVEGDLSEIILAGNGQYRACQAYLNSKGAPFYMRHEVVIKWKSNISNIEKNQIIEQFALVELKTTRLFDIYQTINPLFTSQAIFESNKVEYCTPNVVAFVTLTEYIPNDPYFERQFYLRNTGQIFPYTEGVVDADMDVSDAWDITMGDPNIVVLPSSTMGSLQIMEIYL